MSVIVTVCGDPGGANALAPVLKLLQAESKIQLINYTYYQAEPVLKCHDLMTLPLFENANIETAVMILQNHHADFLLTATSVNDQDWEKLFILAARELSIHSVAILDFWSNYVARFSQEKNNLNCIPNKIAVMDASAKSHMIAAGFSSETIMITGQPAFDSLQQLQAQFSEEKRIALRATLNVGCNDLLITFVSQPIRKFYGLPSDERYLGYDEYSTLSEIISVLETIQITASKKILLLILPHPKETLADLHQFTSNKIKIKVMNLGNHREYLLASDLVLGMCSILLVEACYLACVVLSVQIGLRSADVLPTNQTGASLLINRSEALLPTLHCYLFDQTKRAMLLNKPITSMESATDKIVKYISQYFNA